jgi:hypothetical protein
MCRAGRGQLTPDLIFLLADQFQTLDRTHTQILLYSVLKSGKKFADKFLNVHIVNRHVELFFQIFKLHSVQ